MSNNKPPSSIVMILVIVGAVVFTILTWSIGYPMNVADYFNMMMICAFLIVVTFMTSVKFQSPLALTENETFTTFNSRVETVYDEEWDTTLGVVFVGGFNSAKRLLSKADIEAGGVATLLITADARMIESVASSRFIIARGKSHDLNAWESAAFMARPSMHEAFGDEIKTARISFMWSSSSLHADTTPTDAAVMEDLAAVLQQWRGEIAASVDLFTEEFLRKLKSIKTFQESPLERLASEQKWKQTTQEDKDERR
jgi:hypothetical protein